MPEPRTLPTVTADQMREVDRILTEEVGLQLVQMMENAGRHLAALAVERFSPQSCTVVAGSGGNGGSGLDATTGDVGDPCVHADVTLTLGLPKQGLSAAPAEVRGEVHTADIGVPDWVYGRVGVTVDRPFREGTILRTSVD